MRNTKISHTGTGLGLLGAVWRTTRERGSCALRDRRPKPPLRDAGGDAGLRGQRRRTLGFTAEQRLSVACCSLCPAHRPRGSAHRTSDGCPCVPWVRSQKNVSWSLRISQDCSLLGRLCQAQTWHATDVQLTRASNGAHETLKSTA